MSEPKNLRDQVVSQCIVVHDLALALARIHSDYAALMATGCSDDIINIVGRRTASFMETLGNMLNGMDAVDADEAERQAPVFEAAQQLWPTDPEILQGHKP